MHLGEPVGIGKMWRGCALLRSWKGFDGLHFLKVTAFELAIGTCMKDQMLDLDLSGSKHNKSLDVWIPGLRVQAPGLSSLTDLDF